jgi:Domain of unknown function (DUF4265)
VSAGDHAGGEYVKVRMSDDDGFTETAWAVRVTPGVDEFRLDNSPFYAYRVSYMDVVEGRSDGEGLYDFVRVVHRSGNRTVRLMFRDDKAESPYGQRVLDGVTRLGCTFEGMFNTVISITVPADVDLGRVSEYLTSTGLDWEYADPKYEDLFGP